METPTPEQYDYVVIGGGIVGVATARQLIQKYPTKRIALLEKEPELASHQTGHNSGVIHAGVYYVPGSLKAELCKRGSALIKEFCQQNHIPVENCGKLLVATNSIELERMKKLYQRCLDNGIEVKKLDKQQLHESEPNIEGEGALHVEATSIVDFRLITEKLAQEFIQLGGHVLLNSEVLSLTESSDWIELQYADSNSIETIQTRYLISCAGLMSDRLAKMLNIDVNFQIIPYRGEYYKLPEKYDNVVNHLIYPIPDPDLPFLGVHLTKMIDGCVTVGPNAVQGWKREGYKKYNFSFYDTWEMLSFAGFWKVTWKHLASGINEYKNSWLKAGYLKQVNKYCPQISLHDLQPYPPGIRAQAVMADGSLVHDFLFAQSTRSLHVCNAPSPAATSSLAISEYLVDKLDQEILASNELGR